MSEQGIVIEAQFHPYIITGEFVITDKGGGWKYTALLPLRAYLADPSLPLRIETGVYVYPSEGRAELHHMITAVYRRRQELEAGEKSPSGG
jgi:hypothetical protein